MSRALIRYEPGDDGIAVITLDDPPANAYSYEMMKALDAAILEARMDDGVHALVLRGAGEKFFCAGADIRMLSTATPSSGRSRAAPRPPSPRRSRSSASCSNSSSNRKTRAKASPPTSRSASRSSRAARGA